MIKKITIEVGGKEIELTPKQAKKLYDELDELYGKDTGYPTVPYYPYYPWWYPYRTYPYTIGDTLTGTISAGDDITMVTGDANTNVTTYDCPQNAGITFTS